MPVQEVDIKIKATDEASSIFERVAKSAQSLNREARGSGDRDIERLIRGGGALAIFTKAAEIAEKAADAISESLRGVASGTETVSQGIGHIIEGTTKSIPVLTTVVDAFTSIRGAGDDLNATLASMTGESDKSVQSLKSTATLAIEAASATELLNKEQEYLLRLRREMEAAHAIGTDKDRLTAQVEYEKNIAEAKKIYDEQRHSSDKDTRDNATHLFDQGVATAERVRQDELARADKKDKEDAEKRQVEHEKKMRGNPF